MPSRLLCPWDSPGKSTGVDCHFLLQGIFPTQGFSSMSPGASGLQMDSSLLRGSPAFYGVLIYSSHPPFKRGFIYSILLKWKIEPHMHAFFFNSWLHVKIIGVALKKPHCTLVRMAIVRKWKITSVGEDEVKLEPSCMAGGNVKWHKWCGKQYGVLWFLKNLNGIIIWAGDHACSSSGISCSVVSYSLQPRGLQPARLLCPWDSPGKSTGVGCHSPLQGIFLTQRLNSGLLHCRQILYHLSHQGSPITFIDWYISKITESRTQRLVYPCS